ncbi:MAG: peptide chain release factor 2, partial [Oscillospiraceae bacterium]|nr:peptide chain release factor 2 [Oscillospiraceae bacterium]
MIEFDEYKVKLNALRPTLGDLKVSLKLDDASAELETLVAETEREGFWNDVDAVSRNQKRTKQLNNKINGFNKLESTWDDLFTICEMAIEENDASMLPELEEGFADFEAKLEETK